MGGRITDLAVFEPDPTTYWVATASGGLLKTINNGITFEHQFDKRGDRLHRRRGVAPSDPNIVWVGTGEDNPRNSVSYGDGVYKSTDGGKTWKNMGLKKTYQIGKIVDPPEGPEHRLRRRAGPAVRPERGARPVQDDRRRQDLGEGAVRRRQDRRHRIPIMHPTDPETLIVAAWERPRDGFDSWPGTDVPKPDGYDGYDPIRKWGPGGGLYKTTDGGKTWKKLQDGLPTSNIGRIGLDWYRKDPNVALRDHRLREDRQGAAAAAGLSRRGGARCRRQGHACTQVIPDSPAAKAGLKVGDVITAVGEQGDHRLRPGARRSCAASKPRDRS